MFAPERHAALSVRNDTIRGSGLQDMERGGTYANLAQKCAHDDARVGCQPCTYELRTQGAAQQHTAAAKQR